MGNIIDQHCDVIIAYQRGTGSKWFKYYKGSAKLIDRVKIALLFVTSKLFQFTILNLSG